MLYDLNVPWSPNQTPAELERTITFLSSLGYNALALNHSISTLPSQLNNPIPLTQPFTLPSQTTLLRRCTLSISDPSLNHRLSHPDRPLYHFLRPHTTLPFPLQAYTSYGCCKSRATIRDLLCAGYYGGC